MRKWLRMALMVFLLNVAGCIPSLHPLYTQEDVIFDPSLLGEWGVKDGKERWVFTQRGDKEYKLRYVDSQGKQGDFIVHLVALKNRKYLDFYPEVPDKNDSVFYTIHLLPMHTFARIQQEGDTLKTAMMRPEWLQKLIEKNPKAIRHEESEHALLITAQPKEIQAFLLKYDGDQEAWGENTPLTRRTEKAEK